MDIPHTIPPFNWHVYLDVATYNVDVVDHVPNNDKKFPQNVAVQNVVCCVDLSLKVLAQ